MDENRFVRYLAFAFKGCISRRQHHALRVGQKTLAEAFQRSLFLNPAGEKNIVAISLIQLMHLIELLFGKDHRHDLGGFLLRKCVEALDIDTDAAAATDRERYVVFGVREIEVDVGEITQVGPAGRGNRETKCLRGAAKQIGDNASAQHPSGNEKAPRRA